MPNLCAIFDIDGTLADNRERVHAIMGTSTDYDTYQVWPPEKWDLFYAGLHEDKPIVKMVQHARYLTLPILFFTGRKERGRAATWEWLQAWVFNRTIMMTGTCASRLHMRRDDDDRPSWEVKEEHLKARLATGVWEPVIAFDDCLADIEMYRKHGLVGAHVGERQRK